MFFCIPILSHLDLPRGPSRRKWLVEMWFISERSVHRIAVIANGVPFVTRRLIFNFVTRVRESLRSLSLVKPRVLRLLMLQRSWYVILCWVYL